MVYSNGMASNDMAYGMTWRTMTWFLIIAYLFTFLLPGIFDSISRYVPFYCDHLTGGTKGWLSYFCYFVTYNITTAFSSCCH